jgi:argininosuccinate synthase
MAYAGGPDVLDAVPRLAAEYGEVVAVTLDAGQGKELEAVRDRALAAGAARAHVLDVRDEFARSYIVPALKAGALYYEGRDAAPALERALVAAKLLEIARIEQAGVVAHSWAGAERRSFEQAMRTLEPSLTVIAATASSNDGPRSTKGFGDRSARAFAPQGSAAEAEAEITFMRGVPTALNRIEMAIPDLVSSLGVIAHAHEPVNPAASSAHRVLQTALLTLRRFRVDPEVDRFAATVAGEYAAALEEGGWFRPLRAALDAFVVSALDRASGVVRLRLFQGRIEASADDLPSRPIAVLRLEGAR